MPSEIVGFIPSDPFYEFSSTIDSIALTFNVRWNGRDLSWYFDVLDADRNPIVEGIKLVLGTYLGRRVGARHPLFLNGAFFAQDTSGANREAGFDDLGTRVRVYYATEFDLAAIITARCEQFGIPLSVFEDG
jgi:hypothetical protein